MLSPELKLFVSTAAYDFVTSSRKPQRIPILDADVIVSLLLSSLQFWEVLGISRRLIFLSTKLSALRSRLWFVMLPIICFERLPWNNWWFSYCTSLPSKRHQNKNSKWKTRMFLLAPASGVHIIIAIIISRDWASEHSCDLHLPQCGTSFARRILGHWPCDWRLRFCFGWSAAVWWHSSILHQGAQGSLRHEDLCWHRRRHAVS